MHFDQVTANGVNSNQSMNQKENGNRKGNFMGTHSSGYYSIDGDYNIIGFNETAKEIYPSLQMGMKCYKALMGLDAPCPPCPVVNGIRQDHAEVQRTFYRG